MSAAFLDDLRGLGPPVEAVHGNIDEPTLQAALPEQTVVEVGGARIGLVHDPGPAHGRAARLRARFAECHAIVDGHTHAPDLTQYEGVWILNPGSPTERRRAPWHAMLVREVAGGIRPQLVEL